MTNLKVAILDDYSEVALQAADWDSLNAEIMVFTDPTPLGALSDTLHPFDLICLMRERTPFPECLITELPNLRLLVTTGPRNQSIDLAAARTSGISVCGTRSRKTTTAELTMTLMLTLSRKILPEAASLRAGGWQGPPGRDLAGRSLGLVGLGNIGQQVAKLGQAFACRFVPGRQTSTMNAQLGQVLCVHPASKLWLKAPISSAFTWCCLIALACLSAPRYSRRCQRAQSSSTLHAQDLSTAMLFGKGCDTGSLGSRALMCSRTSRFPWMTRGGKLRPSLETACC